MRNFDTERVEAILKKLLQDDYERLYEVARQNIISKTLAKASYTS